MLRRTLWLILAGIVLIPPTIFGLVWLNLRLVELNPQDSNFMVYWKSTRAIFFDERSLYAAEIVQEIQKAVYGRPPGSDEYTFVPMHPFYATILFAPFALIESYPLARSAWLIVLELNMLLCVLLAARLVAWRPPIWLMLLFFFFSLIWVHGFLPLVNGDAVIWGLLFLLLTLTSLRAERYEFAGFFLAWITVQPLPFLLASVFLVLWSLSKRHWVLLTFWLGAIALMTAVGMFFQPNWPVEFLRNILHHAAYPSPDTLGDALRIWWPGVGSQVGWIVTSLIALVLVVEWWLAFRKDFRWFLWTFCLTLVLGQWVGIPTSPNSFILFLLPLMLVFSTWGERNRLGGRVLTTITVLLLSGGLWPLFWAGRADYPWPQVPPSLFIPVPLLLSFLLYWVRWWAIKEPVSFRKLYSP